MTFDPIGYLVIYGLKDVYGNPAILEDCCIAQTLISSSFLFALHPLYFILLSYIPKFASRVVVLLRISSRIDCSSCTLWLLDVCLGDATACDGC